MQTLERLQKKIKTAHDLLSVVKTMKTLAAVNIRQLETAVAALDEYNRIVDKGWQVLLRFQQKIVESKKIKNTVLLVLGSDQGMCGQFNESIIRYALQYYETITAHEENVFVWTGGERIRTGLEDSVGIREHFQLPGGIRGINELVGRIVVTIDSWQQRKAIQTMYLLHNKLAAGGTYEPVRMRLLPLDQEWLDSHTKSPWPNKCLPMAGIERDSLFSHLFRQYIFAALYRSFAQSMASENAARLAAMQAAEKNILEMEEELQGKYREARQYAITTELLDIIAGFEAISGE